MTRLRCAPLEMTNDRLRGLVLRGLRLLVTPFKVNQMTFDESVYEYLKTVPKGKVVTYGMIAHAIGRPRAARQVGNALHRNPTPVIIPCHRVVNCKGRLAPAFAFGGIDVQAFLLRAEGVQVTNGYVDLEKYLWQGYPLGAL